MSKKLSVVLAGSVMTQSGYGSHSRDIARALIKSNKYNVSIVPIPWGNTPHDALNPENPDDKIILDRIIERELTVKPDVFIHITIPNEFQAAGKFSIGITAGIETTACKPEWIDGCNRMDLVVATSNHSANVFKRSSFEKRDNKTNQVMGILKLIKPVRVLFEGVNTEVYNGKPNTKTKISKMLNKIPEDFCFLFVGHWLQGDLGKDRKDVGMLIKTFIETFKRKSRKNMPALVLKTGLAGFSIMERKTIEDRIQQIRTAIKRSGWKKPLPNIYLLNGSLSDDEMNSLYNHRKIKAMVSFTKGEGFGRPLLEFTTTGKPVIASAWSGQMDFLSPDYSILLRGDLSPVDRSAVNDWIIEGSQWFNVNYHYASQQFLNIFKSYDSYLQKSNEYKEQVISKFSFEKMTEKLCEIIDVRQEYLVDSETNPVQHQIKLPKLATDGGEPPKKINLPKLEKV